MPIQSPCPVPPERLDEDVWADLPEDGVRAAALRAPSEERPTDADGGLADRNGASVPETEESVREPGPQAGHAALDGSTRKGMEQVSPRWTVLRAVRMAVFQASTEGRSTGFGRRLLLLSWLFLRKTLVQAARGARIIVLLTAVLLAARGVLAVQGSGAPFDRARAARTVAKLRHVDERVQEFQRARGRFPTDLRELGLSRQALVDELRHELQFELLPEASGFRLWVEGAPLGRHGLEDYYPRPTIERAGKHFP